MFQYFFQCGECKQLLDGMYYLLMGRFLCERDYNVSYHIKIQMKRATLFYCNLFQRLKKKCNDCGILIDGLYYSDNNNKTLCEVCYKVHSKKLNTRIHIYVIPQKTLGKCKRCNGVLEGNLLKIPGASFHTDCFRCKVCQLKPLYRFNVHTSLDL